jgi:hypothetical protein
MGAREEELAWAAGLFEGDGSITRNGTVPVLQMKLCDEDVLRRFSDIMRVGTVYGPYSYEQADGHKRKPFWVWNCQSANAEHALRCMAPWLGYRRLGQARRMRLLDPTEADFT